MIPKNNSKFAEWLPLTVGMKVSILTEAGPKDNEKLKSPFYCDVMYKDNTYAVGFSWAAYSSISSNDSFGPDTANWIGKTIQYVGKKPVKTKTGTVQAHMWVALDEEIDLNQETPF